MAEIINGENQLTLKKHKMIYKSFYLSQNPSQEYQYQNGMWVKRNRGSKQPFYNVDANGQNVLNTMYKPKGNLKPFWMYSNSFKTVVGIGALVGGFYLYRKYSSKIKTII
jgi:hypothetical protein